MGPPNGGFAVPSPPIGPGHPGSVSVSVSGAAAGAGAVGYPVRGSAPPDVEMAGTGVGMAGAERAHGGGAEAMVVEEDEDEAWRRPTPHNARRRAGKHTRRVIVK